MTYQLEISSMNCSADQPKADSESAQALSWLILLSSAEIAKIVIFESKGKTDLLFSKKISYGEMSFF